MFDEQGNMVDATDKVIAEVEALSRRCGNIIVITCVNFHWIRKR